MRVPRIYSSVPVSAQTNVELDQRASHYLLHVLRVKTGYKLRLFDGSGEDFDAQVATTGRKTISVEIGTPTPSTPESPLHTTLAIGLSKGERMDWLIQKATELGVNCVQPLFCERVEVKLSGDRVAKKIEHWSNVAISACEQCGRGSLPVINPPLILGEWLQQSRDALQLIFTDGGQPLSAIEEQPQSINLLIGPEGGFSQTEKDLALASQYKPISLGPRILRTETAPIAALTLVQSRWGDC